MALLLLLMEVYTVHNPTVVVLLSVLRAAGAAAPVIYFVCYYKKEHKLPNKQLCVCVYCAFFLLQNLSRCPPKVRVVSRSIRLHIHTYMGFFLLPLLKTELFLSRIYTHYS